MEELKSSYRGPGGIFVGKFLKEFTDVFLKRLGFFEDRLDSLDVFLEMSS